MITGHWVLLIWGLLGTIGPVVGFIAGTREIGRKRLRGITSQASEEPLSREMRRFLKFRRNAGCLVAALAVAAVVITLVFSYLELASIPSMAVAATLFALCWTALIFGYFAVSSATDLRGGTYFIHSHDMRLTSEEQEFDDEGITKMTTVHRLRFPDGDWLPLHNSILRKIQDHQVGAVAYTRANRRILEITAIDGSLLFSRFRHALRP